MPYPTNSALINEFDKYIKLIDTHPYIQITLKDLKLKEEDTENKIWLSLTSSNTKDDDD